MTQQYLDFMNKVFEEGAFKEDRTGTGTKSIFGHQMRFDLQKGFPLLTTKKTSFNLIKSELLWFLKGDTNIRYLLQNANYIWSEWAFKKYVESDAYTGEDMTNFGVRSQQDAEFNKVYKAELKKFEKSILDDEEFALEHGDLGHVYGYQWRNWGKQDDVKSVLLSSEGISFIPVQTEAIDQIANVIEQIKTNPDSRRLIVNAWNVSEIDDMALPPCHTMFQFYVNDGKLSCQLYQRSADIFLGVPFNIASYALLTHLIANECGLEVGDFVHSFGDAHLYVNHFEQVKEQLSREPYELCELVLKNPEKSIFDMEVGDIAIKNYKSHPAIKAPIAV